MSEGRRWVQKVIIVITDGNPNPGPETKLVKEQVRRLKNMGFKTINISVGDSRRTMVTRTAYPGPTIIR
ncbi:hypothetical protein N752_26065 [Desulforamulus aquiferis]|nr:vWA domain-containing protein [Desulforamulus aquiferis]RYD02282.1 hypothetical protein N752_26065 [Desulforamulus aquiferis]